MTEEPDPDRLRALEQRLAKIKGEGPKQGPRHAAAAGLSQGEVAWRMVIELVSGMFIGLSVGYGLDWLFGTLPVFLVVFGLFGFVAGVKVMIRTAADMNKDGAVLPPDEGDGRG